MSSTERLVVELPSDLVEALRHAVKKGPFASESELLASLLRAWQGSDELSDDELEEIRAAVAEGLADVEAGRVVDADEVHAELRARIEAAAARRK
jgi:antitoxin ParD1/3/4